MGLATTYNESVENPRYEKICGEEKLLARPAAPHAFVAANIIRILGNYLRGRRCRVMSEIDVFLDADNRFIPDIVVVCDRKKIKYNGVHGAPDLVVEILSPGTAKYDRLGKKAIYEKFAVKEYWLVNPKDRSLEVNHLVDGKFVVDDIYHDYLPEELELLTDNEKAAQKFNVKVSLYDDLEVSVKEVFEDIDI